MRGEMALEVCGGRLRDHTHGLEWSRLFGETGGLDRGVGGEDRKSPRPMEAGKRLE